MKSSQFTVPLTDDAIAEASEQFNVSMNNLSPTTVAASDIDITDTATGTITDNDSATVTIEDVSVAEDGTMSFTALLTGDVDGGFNVDAVFTDGTATGSDYANFSQTLIFAGTDGETVQFTASLLDDAIVEANETFTVSLNALSPGVVPLSSIDITDTATGTIIDNDSATVTIEDVSSAEDGSLVFTASIDQAVDGGFSVDVEFTNATAGSSDYTGTTQTLNFNGTANETVQFTVPINDDSLLEAAESFNISMTNLVAATVPVGSIDVTDTATGTIIDNDGANVTIEDVAANEDGTLVFTATLDSAVDGGFDVDVVFTDATASGSDYTGTTQTLSFTGTAGETVQFSVALNDDAIVEDAETFSVSMTNVVSAIVPAGTINVADTATGTINDNDTATVTIEDVTVAEDGVMQFTALLTGTS